MNTPTAMTGFLPTNEPSVRFWLMALLATGVLILALMARMGMASIEWLGVLALFMMGMVRWSSSAIAVFAILSFVIFWATQFSRPSLLSLGEAMLAGAALVYLGIHYRLWQAIQRARRGIAEEVEPTHSLSPARLLSELLAIVAVAMGAALLARGAIAYLYIGRAFHRDVFGMSPHFLQFLCGVVLTGGVSLLLVAIVRTLSRRGWNRLEAEMALNEETYSLLLVEFRRLTRRRRR